MNTPKQVEQYDKSIISQGLIAKKCLRHTVMQFISKLLLLKI